MNGKTKVILSKKIKLLLLFFCFIFPINVQAENLKWKKIKTIAFEVKKLPQGKIVKKYFSPNKNYELIVYHEKTKDGLSLYIKSKNDYKFIDDSQQVKNIRWENDSSKVYFNSIKRIDFTQISYWKINYLLRKNILFAEVLVVNN